MHATAAIALTLFLIAGSMYADELMTREHVRHMILDDYAVNDCTGYLHSRSRFYRRTFQRALTGDIRALRTVFRDSQFHSGDNEAWCSIPGAILYVVGDQRFAELLMSLSPVERHWAVTYNPAAEPFDPVDSNHALKILRRDFPLTYGFYVQYEARTKPNQGNAGKPLAAPAPHPR